MLNSSDNPPDQQDRSQFLFLKKLLDSHPIAFWGGLWIVLMSLGGVAAFGLLNPGPIEQAGSKPTPITEVSIPTPTLPSPTRQQPTPARVKASTPALTQETSTNEGLPLSLFAAIAIGCAVGSLLVTRALQSPDESDPTPKRIKPITTTRKKRQRLSKSHRVAKMPKPAKSEPIKETLGKQRQATNNQLAQVTVLPPEESHPLDGGKENLAELLDLRKRQSLTSLMRGQ